MRYPILIISLCLFLFSSDSFGLNAYEQTVGISVLNKEGQEIINKIGLILEPHGIVVTDSIVIKMWLDDVMNTLFVNVGDEKHQIIKLIYLSKKKDIAIFSIRDKEIKRDKVFEILKSIDQIKKFLKKDRIPDVKDIKKKIQKDVTPPSPEKVIIIDHPKKALELYKKGRYEEAIEIYKRLLELNPSAELYNRLGVLYILMGNYSEAIEILDKGKEIEPENPETYFNLGISHFLKGDKDILFEYYLILNRLDKKRAEDFFDFVYR